MNGIINVLKPPAMSSSDVVSHIRRITGIKKVGHTGTLDPGAAGVLPVCLGRATKLADYIMAGEKEYIAELTFGAATDTLDSYGAVLCSSAADINRERLCAVLPEFLGASMQIPPMYSAVKQGGQPLYKLARKGIEVKKPPRRIFISDIKLLAGEDNRFLLKIRCSKGTYVRTLLSDLAARLETPAYTSFLLRSKSGGFTLEHACTFDEIQSRAANGTLGAVVTPMEEALHFMEKVVLPPHLYEIVLTGTPVDTARAGLTGLKQETDYAVYCRGELLGIARCTGQELKIVSMLKILNGGDV